jgi:hypothetical protein
MAWLFLSIWACIAMAQEPTPMGFDDMLELSEPAPESPARAAQRQKRRVAIDFAEEVIEGAIAKPTVAIIDTDNSYLITLLKLAHLYHEEGRQERDAAALQQAADTYTELLDLMHPDHPQRDHVTFFLGFASIGAGKKDDGRRHLQEVLSRWPGSKFAGHAHLHLGELDFAESKYANAAAHFTQARRTEFVHFAMYKEAWCSARLDQLPHATSQMMQAFTASNQPPLRRAMAEVIIYWSNQVGRQVPPEVIQAIRGPRPSTCLDQLSQLRTSLRSAPMSHEAPTIQTEVVRCYASVHQCAAARKEASIFGKRFGKGSVWRARHEGPATKEAKTLSAEINTILRSCAD